MKAFQVVGLFLSISVGTLAYAQETSTTTLKIDRPLESKTFNAFISPLPLVVKMVNVGVDIGVTEQLSVGPEITSWNYKSTTRSSQSFLGYQAWSSYGVDAKSLGLRLKWSPFSFRFEDGWYLLGTASYVKAEVTRSNFIYGTSEGTLSGSIVSAVAGYQWFWKSGFNMSVGFGAASANIDRADMRVAEGDETNPYDFAGRDRNTVTGEFNTGWVF